MNAFCEKFPELDVADVKVKFTKGEARNITEEQAEALGKISADYGIVFEAVREFEKPDPDDDEITVIDDGKEDEPVNLDAMTAAQLIEFARVNDINIGGATKKANILQAIVDAMDNADA